MAEGLGGNLKELPSLARGPSRSRLHSLKKPQQPRGTGRSRAALGVNNKTNALLTNCRALNPPGRQDDVSPDRLLDS